MTVKTLAIQGISVLLLATCLAVPAGAQPIPGDASLRLLSAEEGDAIVQTAWELRRGLLPKPDCSHFVHAIYSRAGLDYEYAQTSDIFDGIDPFQRVKEPQPGDLVVWQGHVGIVVDPLQHSFFSSVVTGFAIEDYRSNYWLGRGAPRFYRYMVDDAHAARMAARSLVKQPIPAADPQPGATGTDSLENPSGNSKTGLNDLHSAGLASRSNVRQPILKTELQPGLTRKDSFENLNGDSRTNAVALSSNDAEIRDVVFVSQRKKPSKEEVLAAIMRSVDANGQRLLRGTRLDSQPSVALAEQFTVTRLEIKNNSGWAELKVKRTASFLYGKADPHAATDTWQTRLTRQEQGWVALVPQDRVYIRPGPAFAVLASHLAIVSRAPADNQELKKVVRILDQLLSQNADDIEAGGSK